MKPMFRIKHILSQIPIANARNFMFLNCKVILHHDSICCTKMGYRKGYKNVLFKDVFVSLKRKRLLKQQEWTEKLKHIDAFQ